MTAVLHLRKPEAKGKLLRFRALASATAREARAVSKGKAVAQNPLLLLVWDLRLGVVWKSVCRVSTSSLGTMQPVISALKTPLKAHGKLDPKLLNP